MSTGDKRTNFEQKRFLSQQRLDDSFFAYLDAKLDDLTSRVWGAERGVFGTLTLSADGADKFKVAVLPGELLDGNGRILTINAALAEGVQFENTNLSVYYVAARHVGIPSGVVRNPRNDVIFYDQEEDSVGEVAYPDSVAESVGTLIIGVDSVFEAGVSAAGRLVTVWLVAPKSDVEAVAIERNLIVSWDGANNFVTTAGLLGQTGGSASVTSTDYRVVGQGLSVSKGVDLSATAPYAFIGRVTGAGAGNPPITFSTVGQIDVSDGINPDLQEAYTTGRTITPSAAYGGSVLIQSADSGDFYNALLRLNREGATEMEGIGLVTVSPEEDGAAFVSLLPLQDSAGAKLATAEAATLQAANGVIDFGRVGVDLTDANVGLDQNYDIAVLSGFAAPGLDGMYLLIAVTGVAQVQIAEMDEGAVLAWPGVGGEAGAVTFYRVRAKSGDGNFGYRAGTYTRVGLQGDNVFTGGPSVNSVRPESALRACAGGAEDILRLYDDGVNTLGTPWKRVKVDRHGVLTLSATGVGSATGSDDKMNCQFRLDRIATSGVGRFQLVAVSGPANNVTPIALLKILEVSGPLEATEPCTVATPSQLALTRGGALNLLSNDVYMDIDYTLCEVFGSNEEADNGVYAITARSSNTITLGKLYTGGPATFIGATCNIRILIPLAVHGHSDSIVPRFKGHLFTGMDNYGGDPTPMTIYPRTGEAGMFKFLSNRIDSIFLGGDPRDLLTMDADPVAVASPGGTLRIGKWYGTEGAENGIHAPMGLNFQGLVNGVGAADLHGVTIAPMSSSPLYTKLSSRLMGLIGPNGEDIERFTPIGYKARGSYLDDDFNYRIQAGLLNQWAESGIGVGTNYYNTTAAGRAGGYVRLLTAGTGVTDVQQIASPYICVMRNGAEAAAKRAYIFTVRVAICENGGAEAGDLNAEYLAIIRFGGTTAYVGLAYWAAGVATTWKAVSSHSAVENNALTAGAPVIGQLAADDGWVTAAFYLNLDADEILYTIKGDGGVGGATGQHGALTFKDQAHADWDGSARIEFICTQLNINPKSMLIDHVRLQECGLKGYLVDEFLKE